MRFLKLLEVESATADGLFVAIKNYFLSKDISIEKVTMLTSDGASVMLGANNGLQAKIKVIFLLSLINKRHFYWFKED